MNSYKVYGMNVESDFPLECAEKVEDTQSFQPEITIRAVVLPEDMTRETPQEIARGNGCMYAFGMDWSGIRYVNQGSFKCSGGNLIEYQLRDTCNMVRIEQILMSWCLGVLMVQRKEIALHGSEVYMDHKAVAICGDSGAGKSSFTMEALLQGASYMADDIIRVTDDGNGEFFGYPSYPQRKLCADTIRTFGIPQEGLRPVIDDEREKYSIRNTEQYHGVPEYLDAMIVIEKGNAEKTSISEVSGADKLKLLIEYLFVIGAYQDCGMDPDTFRKCIAISKQIHMFRLLRPAEGMTTKEQVALVREVLSELKE